MQTVVITTSDSGKHEMGTRHPESPARTRVILDYLKQNPIPALKMLNSERAATKSELAAAHAQEYIDFIFRIAPSEAYFVIDADTKMNRHSLSACLNACGAILNAIDRVCTGHFANAFCCIRPPGHHAEKNRAMGFCFFNNVAIGARYVLNKYNLSRVAIVDFDVHHANGSEYILRQDSRILLASTFQEYIFPAKAGASIPGHIINQPLAAGCDSRQYRKLFKEKILPELKKFKPEFIFISAGFDAHKDDPLAGINLETEDFAWITHKINEVAGKYAKGRIVSGLEGGYNLHALAKSAHAHIRALTTGN